MTSIPRKPRAGKSLADMRPELNSEWDYEENSPYTPATVTAQSNQKMSWVCTNGHRWVAEVCGRFRGRACPYCSKQRVLSGINDFATLYPELAAEWDHEKNLPIRPSEIFPSTSKKFHWICPKNVDHKWEARVGPRTLREVGCPYCSNRLVRAGFNDLATTHPDLALEWHPDNHLNPTEVSFGAGVRIKWQCQRKSDHIWDALIPTRTSQASGCPSCAMSGTSRIESTLRELLTGCQGVEVTGSGPVRIEVPWGSNSSMYVDILAATASKPVPSVIEYDGEYWHKDKSQKDIEKTVALLGAGHTVVRVRENSLPHLSIEHENLYQLSHRFGDSSSLDDIVSRIHDILV